MSNWNFPGKCHVTVLQLSRGCDLITRDPPDDAPADLRLQWLKVERPGVTSNLLLLQLTPQFLFCSPYSLEYTRDWRFPSASSFPFQTTMCFLEISASQHPLIELRFLLQTPIHCNRKCISVRKDIRLPASLSIWGGLQEWHDDIPQCRHRKFVGDEVHTLHRLCSPSGWIYIHSVAASTGLILFSVIYTVASSSFTYLSVTPQPFLW